LNRNLSEERVDKLVKEYVLGLGYDVLSSDKIRNIRLIVPKDDVFNVLYEYDSGQGFVGALAFETEKINFVGQSPLKTNYDAAVITPVFSWVDGGIEKNIYSLLMLKYLKRENPILVNRNSFKPELSPTF